MNTNRIKQALAEGKAIKCKTNNEAQQLFEIADWKMQYGDSDYEYSYYWADPYEDSGWSANYEESGSGCHEVIPFTALTRSRLAECLGVDDGQKFEYTTFGFGPAIFSVEDDGDKLRRWSLDGTHYWNDTDIFPLIEMINHPEKITPCPRWSEATIAAARAAELLGFSEVTRHDVDSLLLELYGRKGAQGLNTLPTQTLFPEVNPGTTVKLEDIK